MTKSAPLDVQLMTAAVRACDDLRGVFVPVVDQVLKDAPEHVEPLTRLRDLAAYHADSLRFALKDRGARARPR